MADEEIGKAEKEEGHGSSPAARGGAGVYIEGELGAFYFLTMLAGTEPRGVPGTRLERVRFQGVELGFSLDDLILHGAGAAGSSLLEVQSKRDVTFARMDSIFRDVCSQIARSGHGSVPEERHFLAVATQRTSRAISGPYQDVLNWARTADTSAEFFSRLSAKGVANKAMREFVATFRANLVAAGVADEDDAIWRIHRRFLILEFDFEATSPIARIHALTLAQQVLSEEDAPRAEALWSNLIEISIATGTVGGSLDRQALSHELATRGFRLAGDRNFAPARKRLAEMARLALADIGNKLAGMHLPRLDAIATVDDALDRYRFVEIRGESGVGKSGVLRHVAERVSRESNIIVLDPIATPEGGWSAFALLLGVSASAKAFLSDLAVSGGGILFIDGLEMFTEPGRQRTVNDLLREASAVAGFCVIATARPEFGKDGESWLAEDALAALGASKSVTIGDLDDAEVAMLSDHAPELRALLAPDHPAAPIARNLYRLSRLLKAPNAAVIRTEAALADHWWRTADEAPAGDIRAAQRILSDLAEVTLRGRDALELRSDSAARTHLLRSLTLREAKRDHLTFYHDVLRDWSVALRIHEDRACVMALNLSAPASPRLARGVELAGRMALEFDNDRKSWFELLAQLSPTAAHGSWRRQALMAIVRSERGPELLEICSGALLTQGGALFRELCTTIISLETVSTADLLKNLKRDGAPTAAPRSLRTNTTGTADWLLRWCMRHIDEIPIQAIEAVIHLVEMQYFVLAPQLAQLSAKMLFGWLLQLDVRDAKQTIPNDELVGRVDRQVHGRLVKQLRMWSLLLAGHVPEDAKAYLRAVAAERSHYKIKAIRPFSKTLAQTVPAELSALIAGSLIEHRESAAIDVDPCDRAFNFIDADFLPPSPAQPPFLDLLESAPEIGLALIRRLTDEAVALHCDRLETSANGFRLEFDSGTRFFPWRDTYFWSRDQAREYSVASGLKALEAWGHGRLDASQSVDAVLADVLGPDGSCAAYLLVAIDLLISHWPATREALVPFVSCPELLAIERGRVLHDRMERGLFAMEREPAGKVQLADLAARPSRGTPLERFLIGYLADDPLANRVRAQLTAAVEALGGFGEDADFGDPSFMGAYALNVLDSGNWIEVEGGRAYCSPRAETAHLARLSARSSEHIRSSEIEVRIELAIEDPARGSAELAHQAVDYAAGHLPDDDDSDVLKTRATLLAGAAMLVARDGDDALFDRHEEWIRATIDRTLAGKVDRYGGSERFLRFNRPALAVCTLAYLWRRKKLPSDREALITVVAGDGRSAAIAFNAVLDTILASDPRLLKAGMRAAFAGCRRRRSRWDEGPEEQERYARKRAAATACAVAAEIAWLGGGAEPEWPAFPTQRPALRRPVDLTTTAADEVEPGDASAAQTINDASDSVDSQAAALWLRLLANGSGSISWSGEVIDAYAGWSAKLNGHGLPSETEVDERKTDWNDQFYVLLAIALMDMPQRRFEDELASVTGLPDQTFANVAGILLYAADALYFNDSWRPAERAVELRARLAERTMALREWRRPRSPSDLSVDHEIGLIVSMLFMNTRDLLSGTTTYLAPAVFDRIDPLLGPLRPMLAGGPTPLIAICVVNTLLVSPRVRHIEFVLSALETWLERSGSDPRMWLELGVGRKIIDWFEQASIEEPGLLERNHPLRDRIDLALGRLVGLGVPEAHEFESRVERS